MLGEIVCNIMFSSHPIYQKLSLTDYLSDPLKFHVDYSGTLLADVVVENSVSCDVVRHYWGK